MVSGGAKIGSDTNSKNLCKTFKPEKLEDAIHRVSINAMTFLMLSYEAKSKICCAVKLNRGNVGETMAVFPVNEVI